MKKLSEQLSPELLNALKDELVELDKEEPSWFVDSQINEVIFAKEYLEKQPLRCLHGSLYRENYTLSSAYGRKCKHSAELF